MIDQEQETSEPVTEQEKRLLWERHARLHQARQMWKQAPPHRKRAALDHMDAVNSEPCQHGRSIWSECLRCEQIEAAIARDRGETC